MYLRKLPSGVWQASAKHAGQRVSATGRTRGEAQQAAAELLIAAGGTPGRGKAITVDELLTAWFNTAQLSATFRADALSAVKRIPDTFLARRLDEVTPLVIEALYRQLSAPATGQPTVVVAGGPVRPLVPASRIHRIHSVLSTAWTLARRYEWVRDNPFQVAIKPPLPAREVRPPTDAEIDALMAKTPEPLVLYFAVAESLGARRSDLIALQWDDFDLDAQTVTIRRARTYAAGKVHQHDGKTGRKAHRVLALDAALTELLRAHRRHQVGLALAAGLASPVWVFSHDAGVHPWHPEWPTKRFAEIRAAADVPAEVKLHGLRHAMATRLLAAGVPVKVVQGRLGHTRTATTTDVYAHYLPAADQQAAEMMGQLRRAGRAV